MTETAEARPDYAETMRVIGQFIQQEGISEVSVLEYDQGWIIHGLMYKYTSDGFMRTTGDRLLTHDDVRRLRAEFEEKRRDLRKRRWGL